MKEADITISGIPLTFAQSMTLRVAIGQFLLTLSDEGFGKELGTELRDNYVARGREIESLIMKTAR